MEKRIVVLGAGGPAGINFCRALLGRGGEPGDRVADELKFTLLDHNAVHLHFLRPLFELRAAQFEVMEGFDRAQLYAIRMQCDEVLFHAQPDPLVRGLSAYRALDGDALSCFLPAHRTIMLAQDKLEACRAFARSQLAHAPEPIGSDIEIEEAERRFGYPMWVRARSGAGAKHASPVKDRETLKAWASYLRLRYGTPDLIVQPYLPGRDYAVSQLWWHGRLVGSVARERIEYLYPQHAVSGRTGTPVVARIIRSDLLESIASKAIMTISDETGPHGVFCVDLRGGQPGSLPEPTEINAGRFFTTSHFCPWANLPRLYVGLHFGIEEWSLPEKSWPLRVPEEIDGTLCIRHIDAETQWLPPHLQSPEVRKAVEQLSEGTRGSL